GTLDKLESIPGFRTDLSEGRFKQLVETLGLALIGQTAEIAPADKRLYALRDVTGTVSSIPLITSSIMSKKLAEGLDALVLDVKVGSGAFMKTLPEARDLARHMVEVGERMGKAMVALITDMSQPLGQAVGNANEVVESIQILRGEGPADVRALTLALAQEMLTLGGVDPAEAERALDDGRALEKFREIIEAQGGDPRVCDDPLAVLPKAAHTEPFLAERDGFVAEVDCTSVGVGALLLGAGRLKTTDPVDPAVGLTVLKRLGDPVQAGEPLALIHHNDRNLALARQRLGRAWRIGDTAPAQPPLIHDRLARDAAAH
ncbi:MAG: thymidine phosphorylase, partial [Myxococcales bacterium]|nr:thymidine phosphorylase [Myxococcales bacterium]